MNTEEQPQNHEDESGGEIELLGDDDNGGDGENKEASQHQNQQQQILPAQWAMMHPQQAMSNNATDNNSNAPMSSSLFPNGGAFNHHNHHLPLNNNGNSNGSMSMFPSTAMAPPNGSNNQQQNINNVPNMSMMIQQGMLQNNPYAAFHQMQQQHQQAQQAVVAQQYAALHAQYQRQAEARKQQQEQLQEQQRAVSVSAEPEYISLPQGIVPTFANLPSVALSVGNGGGSVGGDLSRRFPMTMAMTNALEYKQKTIYRLSLLSVTEFTVSASMVNQYGAEFPIPVTGLRIHIKKIAKGHGKASYEKYNAEGNEEDNNGGGGGGVDSPEQGRWRIPLACYQALFGYLASSSPDHVVIGIPENQLKAASLGAQRADKSFPSAKKIAKAGVPPGLAQAMAPYQRGGVDFVIDKHGKALIADEMGLGKTVQAIAAMSVYKRDWPLLVLTPSSARYHWEAEILQWLGRNSSVNTCDDYDLLGSEDELELEKKKKKASKRSKTGADELVDSDGSGDENGDVDDSDQDVGMYDDFNDFSGPSLGRLKRASGDRSVRDAKVPSRKRNKAFGNYGGGSMGGGSSFQIMQPWAEKRNNNGLLRESEVHVMTSGKDLWNNRTRVVICSYGLAPTLAEKGKINAKKFPCIICDESHMLKNIKSKRTAVLLPMLKATKRCLMLSGTPAFARPQELFPQLTVLGSNSNARKDGSHQWWQDQSEFLAKYCKSGRGGNRIGGKNMSELHTLLESTVMIRRLKHNILKDLPKKTREKAYIHISDHTLRLQLAKRMQMLREARGVLGKIANDHWDNDGGREDYEKNNPHLQHHDQDEEYQQEEDFETSRKRNLTELFLLTGMGKVPIVVAKLKEWLANPLKGKICVFAHHRAVLDAIEDQALLDRNSSYGASKYIRIDGQTLPRSRQDKIIEFQRNPRVRVALLGVTAAGVAVTLTAASTVWFAEMFWTPSVLIQAEDRVHRIGQQSNVTCLYLIAKGTLDEILWKLVEKKFHALGEFVEGKGKTLAVHRDGGVISTGGYEDQDGNVGGKKRKSKNGTKRTIVDSDVGEDSDDNENGFSSNKQVDAGEELSETDEALSANINSIFGDSSMVDEIMQLGRDERRKSLGPKDDDADSADENDGSQDGVYGDPTRTRTSEIIELSDDDECIEVPPPSSCGTRQYADKVSLKSSCDDPIQIDDDEEGNNDNDSEGVENGNDQSEEDVVEENKENSTQQTSRSSVIKVAINDALLPRPDLRLYKLQFAKPTYGITIAEFSQKIVVKGSNSARQKQYGKNCKPHPGDILVSIQGSQIPKGMKFFDCVNLMKRTLDSYPVVEVVFAEEPTFKEAFRKLMIQGYQDALAKAKAAAQARGDEALRDDEAGVIVIDDDE